MRPPRVLGATVTLVLLAAALVVAGQVRPDRDQVQIAGSQDTVVGTAHRHTDVRTPTPVPTGTRSIPLTFDGLHRSYLLLRPPRTQGSTAMVVLLHGTGANGQAEMRRTGFGPMAATDGFTLVVPQSVGLTWNSGDGCCSVPAARHLHDIGFVRAVIADARTRAAIDPRRIYLVGYSNGGKLSYGVECADAGTIAAMAIYGAGPQITCHARDPVSLFLGYGSRDRLEPPAGKPHNRHGRHQPMAVTAGQFRARDHCGAARSTRHVGPVTVTTVVNCAHRSSVQSALWAGQTHLFPRAPTVPSGATGAALMWAFLSGRSLA